MATQTEEDRKRLVSTWIERDVAAELEQRARNNERSVSGELRLAISEHLQRSNVVAIRQSPEAGTPA